MHTDHTSDSRVLARTALESSGIVEIGNTLARLLDRPLLLEQRISPPFVTRHVPFRMATSSWAKEDFRGRDAHCYPIAGGALELGRLTFAAPALTAQELVTVDQGLIALALTLMNQRAAQDEWLNAQALLVMALAGVRGVVPQELIEEGEALGVDLRRPHYVLAAALAEGSPARPSSDQQEFARSLQSLMDVEASVIGPTLSASLHDRLWVMIDADSNNPVTNVRELMRKAARRYHSTPIIGVSRPGTDYPAACRTAYACLALALRVGGGDVLLELNDLGPMQFLLDAEEPQFTLDWIDSLLQPLVADERAERLRLTTTLRRWVENDFNQDRAAAALFIHRNTLKYRLQIVGQLLGRSLNDTAVRFDLQVAFRIISVLELIESPHVARFNGGASRLGTSAW